jgi:nitroreductase
MLDRQALLDACHFRHACKEFDPARKIGDDDFRFILEVGRLSPSSFGYEPWQFLVIQNPALRERLRAVTWGAQKSLPSASHFVAILTRKQDLRHDAAWLQDFSRRIKGMNDEGLARRTAVLKKFQESDFRLLESERALFDWGGKQAYIALANMMSAAAQIGIDSCAIEGFEQDAAERILAEAGLLDRDRLGLSVMVAFGYRVQAQTPKTRRALEEVVSWVE